MRYQFLHRRTSPIAFGGLVIAHSLARGEHRRHLLLEKRIAFDIARAASTASCRRNRLSDAGRREKTQRYPGPTRLDHNPSRSRRAERTVARQSRSRVLSTPTCRSCHPRLYLAHEAFYRVDQLFEVTVAMEIDLEILDTGRFSVAHQVGSNLGGRTVPG